MSREKGETKPAVIISIIVSGLVIISLIRNATGLYQSRSRLEVTKAKVAELEKKKQAVNQELKNQTDPAALDQAIRNTLNLAKPGETVVVISGSQSATTTSTPSTISPPQTTPISEWWQLMNPAK